MAIGAAGRAPSRRLVTVDVFRMVLAARWRASLSYGSVRYIETLFYQVKATDWGVLALPSLAILAAALVSALPQ